MNLEKLIYIFKNLQMAKGGIIYDMDMMNDLMAQTYASAVKWPKDQILAIRIEHIVKCVQEGKFANSANYSLGEILAELQDNDNSPFDSKSPDSNLRDSSTPLSESSGKSKEQVEPVSKIRQLLTSGTLASPKVLDQDEDDPIARLTKNRGLSGVEITPVNGDASENSSSFIADLQNKAAAKKSGGSKLESALDKLGLQKRKLSKGTTEDQTKKKKRLDDIMFGLGMTFVYILKK